MTSAVFFPKKQNKTKPKTKKQKTLHNPYLFMRKYIRQTHIERHSTEFLTLFFKNVKGVKDRESLRNCNRLGDPKEMTVKCSVVPKLDPGTEKGYYGKTWQNLKKVRIWLIVKYPFANLTSIP